MQSFWTHKFYRKITFWNAQNWIGGAGTAINIPSAIENYGELICGDNVRIGGGCQICTVSAKSKLIIGNNVKVMSESHIIASDSVTVGADTFISWNTQIMDTDYHKIIINEIAKPVEAPIYIGNKCWIASRVNILKATMIPNGCIIASGSTIKGVLKEEKAIYTGLPVKKLADNANWKP